MSSLIIGVSGRKRHGKDVICGAVEAFCAARGIRFYRRGFGDRLKEEVAGLLAELHADHPRLGRLSVYERYNHFIQILHGDGPEKEQYRLLMQWYGTEYRRDTYGPAYWTDRLQEWIEERQDRTPSLPPRAVFVVPDVRFPNEVRCLKRLGAPIFRVARPFPIPENEHISERSLDDYENWSHVFRNDGSLAELQAQVEDWLLQSAYFGPVPHWLEPSQVTAG